MDLGVEEEGAWAQVAPTPKERGVEATVARGAVWDAVGQDPRQVVGFPGILLDQEVPEAIDRDVVRLVELRLTWADLLAAIQQKGQRGSGIGILDIGEPQAPQATTVAAVEPRS